MMDDNEFGKSVNCKGLMDDPFCPDCDTPLQDTDIDCKCCPVCGCPLDWKIYHILND